MVNIFATASALLTPNLVESFKPERLAATLVKVEKEYGVKFNKSKRTFNIVGDWQAVRNAHKSLQKLVSNDVTCNDKTKVSKHELSHKTESDKQGNKENADKAENGANFNVFKIKGNPKRGRHTGETVPEPVVYVQYQEESYLDSEKLNMETVLDDYAKTQTAKKVTKDDLKKILDKNTGQMGRPLNKRLPRGACLPKKKTDINSLTPHDGNNENSVETKKVLSAYENHRHLEPSCSQSMITVPPPSSSSPSQPMSSCVTADLPDGYLKANETHMPPHAYSDKDNLSRYRQHEIPSDSAWASYSDNQRYPYGVKSQETIADFLNSLQSAVSASNMESNLSNYPTVGGVNGAQYLPRGDNHTVGSVNGVQYLARGDNPSNTGVSDVQYLTRGDNPTNGGVNCVQYQTRGDNDVTKSVSVMDGVASMYVPSQHELVTMGDRLVPHNQSVEDLNRQNRLVHSEMPGTETYTQSISIPRSQSESAQSFMVQNIQSSLMNSSQHLVNSPPKYSAANSSVELEHKKILSAYEIHRHLESSCAQPTNIQPEEDHKLTHPSASSVSDSTVPMPESLQSVSSEEETLLQVTVAMDTTDCVNTSSINQDKEVAECNSTSKDCTNERNRSTDTKEQSCIYTELEAYTHNGEDTSENVAEMCSSKQMQDLSTASQMQQKSISYSQKGICAGEECLPSYQSKLHSNDASQSPALAGYHDISSGERISQVSSVENISESYTTTTEHEEISTDVYAKDVTNRSIPCSNQILDPHSRANSPVETTNYDQDETSIENVAMPQRSAQELKKTLDDETLPTVTIPSVSIATTTSTNSQSCLSVLRNTETLNETEVTKGSENQLEDVSMATKKQTGIKANANVSHKQTPKPVQTKRKLQKKKTKQKEDQSSKQTDTKPTEDNNLSTSCQKPKTKAAKSRAPKKVKKSAESETEHVTKKDHEGQSGEAIHETGTVDVKKMGKAKKETTKPSVKREKRVYPCTECDYKGCRKKRLTEHMGRVHGLLTENCRGTQEQTSFPCEQCDKVFVFGKDLNRHKKIVHHGQTYFCDNCQKSYKSKYVFDKHMSTHEEGYVRPMFPCQICERQFTTKFSLGCHIKSEHLGLKKTYICPTCGKTFSQVRSYRQHANVHAGIKPYVCEICNKAFTYDKSLKEHRYMHDNIRRFSCNVCGKAFRQRTCLLIHMKVHKETRDHICSSCGKGFTQRQSLLRHERTHTGDKPYACKICFKTFSDYAVIRKHILASHKKTPQEWKEYVFAEQRKLSSHYIAGGPGYVPRDSCTKIREKNSATVLPPKHPGEPTVIIDHKENQETGSSAYVSIVTNASMATYNKPIDVASIQAGAAHQTADLTHLYQSFPPSMYTSLPTVGNSVTMETYQATAGTKPAECGSNIPGTQLHYGATQASVPQNFSLTQTDNSLSTEESIVAAILKAQGRQHYLGISQDLFTSLASLSSVNVISLEQTQRSQGQSQGQAGFSVSSIPMTTVSTDSVLTVPEVTMATSQSSWSYPGYLPYYSSSGYTEVQSSQND